MIFNSLAFLVFFPITLLLLKFCPAKYRWIPLLGVSYWFYMAWNPALIVLILAATVISYACSHGIERSSNPALRKFYLIFSLLTLFGILFFFKYYAFFADLTVNVFRLFGLTFRLPALSLLLPVGISFYTFQTLSYVIDVYRGTVAAESHFGYYALYVTFFPQLVAGPIERPENLLPQLKNGIAVTAENLAAGLPAFLVGYFRKVVIADTIAVYVDAVYNAPGEQTGLSIAAATLLFTIQIYCDFSGYSQIALGAAQIMGIRLMKNFDMPYASSSVKEFWDRWHISLSSWFKDYLYLPLGGNRKGKLRTQLHVLIVFLASGLWHGANLTFVLWGLLHGAVRVIENLIYPFRKKQMQALREKSSTGFRAVTVLLQILTFLFVCFSWIFFRANTISDLRTLLETLFGSFSLSAEAVSTALSLIGLTPTAIILILLSCACLWIFDLRERRGEPLLIGGENAAPRAVGLATVAWVVIAAAALLASHGGVSSFIYFQF